jgi:predicted metalloprotease
MKRALIIALVALIGLSNAAVAQEPEAPTGPDYGAIGRDTVEFVEPQIDAYYQTLFALEGQDYRSPRVLYPAVDEKVFTACGTYSGLGRAFYCPADETIVIGEDILEWMAEEDDFLPAYVLSHEWAHHVQTLSGTRTSPMPKEGDWDQVYVLENELRADCMSGAWMRSLANRGYLNATDMSAVLEMASEVGDSNYVRTSSHGSGVERLRAVFVGYEEGIVACMTITPLPRR